MPVRALVVFGTRPEAIKLCPLVSHLRLTPDKFDVRTCVTAQHRSMLDQVLTAFDVRPDYDLDLMKPDQTLCQTTAGVLTGLAAVLKEAEPDVVIVQGDTTTTFAAALAAFYAKTPVGHVEAGLRTGDRFSPFPEEMNRVLATRLSDLHFAATEQAAENLRREGVPGDRIMVTGNTVIDAVVSVRDRLLGGEFPRKDWPFLDADRKLVLVTAHRRETFGAGFERICTALRKLAQRPDVQIVYPVHRNPNVLEPVRRLLGETTQIDLIEPLGYVPFVDLMMRSHILLTDSGGIQEEAPSLGKPVLVMREKSERREAIDAGTAILVGTDSEVIVTETARLLDDETHYERMARAHNPYGDGYACRRIADGLLSHLSRHLTRRSA